MAKDIVPFIGAGLPTPGVNLREMRRSILIEGGLVRPRKKYGSAEERKVARKARSKARREERKAFLTEKGLAPAKRKKLTKAEKKIRSKGLRRIRNIYLREHPEEAQTLGIDIGRLRGRSGWIKCAGREGRNNGKEKETVPQTKRV